MLNSFKKISKAKIFLFFTDIITDDNKAQNLANYQTCLNTKANGTKQQKILANWACETYYGVTTDDE